MAERATWIALGSNSVKTVTGKPCHTSGHHVWNDPGVVISYVLTENLLRAAAKFVMYVSSLWGGGRFCVCVQTCMCVCVEVSRQLWVLVLRPLSLLFERGSLSLVTVSLPCSPLLPRLGHAPTVALSAWVVGE